MYTPIAVCVDDDPTTARVVRDALRGLGYRVEFASNKTEAMRLAEELKPALAYVSNEIPGIDALELYRDMQQVSHRTKGIVMTTLADGLMVMVTGQQGLHQVMVKPTAGVTFTLPVDE